MKVEAQKFVQLTYELIVDGQLADQATKERPLGFVFGAGFLLPKFEANIEGKEVGDKFAFTLTPEEGYGVSNPDMVIDVPTAAFMINGKVENGLLVVGNQIPMMTADGMHVVGVVTEVGEESVKMDFNHPMAGKTLNFSGEIVEVREATEADYPHAHGGCNCGDCNCGDCGDGGCDCGDKGCC